MKITFAGAAALSLICLSGAAFADDLVNGETDPRAFLVREAEIRRIKEGGEAGKTEAGKSEAGRSSAKVAAEPRGGQDSAKPEKRSARALAAPAGSEGLKALVARHAAANGVPFSLADAVVRVESRYNPRASNAGNYGLMQIRHQTARGMGYSGSASGLLDAETNARYAMKYLAEAYRLAGGDTCRTIMKYQSGHMATRLSGANRTYCSKVRTISAQN